MPISFSRLRIAGFKSFAEPATLDIRPGLTGIVGPNGCGKSNVVEALRWAMGESSARSMRGDEMDDVIFAGTAARPSRNLAEVTLLLDDAAGLLPPPHHEAAEIEVSRRIERGNGSAYRVNGKEARARDVQTLFADLATGSHSSGMVSQGRVAAIVNAKPDERRIILEEAAGITGLHARRHEAELKLRAAEANLARAEDLRLQLETQLEALKRQARQANRYRNISATIRGAEAEFLSLQRARAAQQRDEARADLHDAQSAVATATASATLATAQATEAAAALPPMRDTEATARTALERHRLGLEHLTVEAARAHDALAAARARLKQIEADLLHAQQIHRDAEAAAARLAEEQTRLAAEELTDPPRLAEADSARIAATDAARAAERAANSATEQAADVAARHRSLTEALTTAEARAKRLSDALAKLRADQDQLQRDTIDPDRIQAAETARAEASLALDSARQTLEDAERARATALQTAQQRRTAAESAASRLRDDARKSAETARAEASHALAAARDAASIAATARARLSAEAQALSDVLAVRNGETWPRMVDQLTVPPGLEAALGAAIGEELESAANTDAPRHWRELPPLDPAQPLPAGAAPLSTLVTAPLALARALSQIGLAEDGAPLQPTLLPGQSIVSRAGAIWRWDGYTIKAGTPTAAAVRLQQRNRLARLKQQLADRTAEAEATTAARTAAETHERSIRATSEAAERTARDAAEAAERTARTESARLEQDATAAEQSARAARRTAEQTLEQRTATAQSLAARAATAAARLAALTEQASRLTLEHDEAAATLATARATRDALPDPAAARAAMDQARAALADARRQEAATSGMRDALTRAAAARTHRLSIIATETTIWHERATDAAARLTDLHARHALTTHEVAAATDAPTQITARAATARDALEAAEATHRATADRLIAAETHARDTDRIARATEATLATARESLLRAEATLAQAETAWNTVAERILDRLGADATLPPPPTDLGPDAEDRLRRRHEKLLREREDMGPVNLRAELEADEIAAQIDTIVKGRDELTTAIARLRGSIGSLNREGRERLSAVFEQVDKHFQHLFAQMFGGGRAHLSMVGSDDPLLAGLEIYAQPPGKKLAALTLLSGGEQALTALSLIFAVFRCNPAPVCVLDEVDAPLDDANVERFCTLLDDMVKETGTRFLVVTHHQLTMARMDRLYGVTMQERGISRLLSVDLTLAAAMMEKSEAA